MRLSIIVPCYNEFNRLELTDFSKFIDENPDAKICFVNDGSTDHTQSLLDEFAAGYAGNVSVVQLPKNQGKAEAVRQGVLFMLTKFPENRLCYLDADLSTPLVEVLRLKAVMDEQKKLLCTFGSRVSIFGSDISRLSYRHYGGRIIATMIDMVLGLSIYDTQCGMKMFHPSLAKKVFDTEFLTRWLFDVEIFARIKLLYPFKELKKMMREIPLHEWHEKGNSKIKLKDILIIPFALARINKRYQPHTKVQIERNSQAELA